jgi:hypothetical protein
MYKFLCSILFVASLNAQLVDGIAIVVKGEGITLFEIKKEMRVSNISMKQASDKLIREKLEAAEIKERKITVSNGEVYDDIKATAKRNNMSVNDLYEAALSANGLNSQEVKAKVKQRLLSKKLYSAITYSQVSQPTEDEIQEYYNLHKDDYTHPAAFTVVIYQARDKALLVQKVQNPMFYSPKVNSHEQVLPYDRISPELARLLSKTPLNGFTSIIPDGKGGYMSFYIKELESAAEVGLEGVRNQLINTMIGAKREAVLSDYFARLKHNAEVRFIRMPE